MTRQQPEPIDALLEGLAVYQVIVRALLHEFVRRSAEGAEDYEAAIRRAVDDLHLAVDRLAMPSFNPAISEELKEKARRNIDQTIALARQRPPA